ncbi:MAG: Rieske (2Fe-2S) protein [Flavobacteriales bacterium]|nr:hypothetical protein [Flavobacteriales bacterium]MCC6577722.1 Rieske (2Fe-2S) protein [Flavobacteriales bacterium]
MDRRHFLLAGCKACAALAAVPALASLESCSTGKSAAGSTALAVENGVLSVPVASLSNGVGMISAKGLDDKLYISKGADGTYKALVLHCPHKGGPVKPSGDKLICNWHGSVFDMDGKVTKGPAQEGLKVYPVEVAGDVLKVRVA